MHVHSGGGGAPSQIRQRPGGGGCICDLYRCFVSGLDPALTHNVRIIGSLFIPSPSLLARMRFRPWNGVFLSDRYLSAVPEADAITAQILALYARHDVEPLVETAVTNSKEFDRVWRLLKGVPVDPSPASLVREGVRVAGPDRPPRPRLSVSLTTLCGADEEALDARHAHHNHEGHGRGSPAGVARAS